MLKSQEQHFASVKPPWVEIDLGQLRKNIRAGRSVLAPASRMMFIIKANAYGHGIGPIAETAASEGVDWFGVAYLSEALQIRERVPNARILVLGVVSPEDTGLLIEKNITPIVVSEAHASGFSKRAMVRGAVLPVHMKIDTGMGRLGFPFPEALQGFRAISGLKGIRVEGVCSHFARVEPDAVTGGAREQYRRFDEILSAIEQPLFRHLSSSRAFLFFPEWDFDAVRPGIALFGYGAADSRMRFHTEPILQWKTTVTQVRTFPAGSPIGYFGTYVTPKETRIAVIAGGYADGYLRELSNRGDVLIRGRRCRVVGRVSMNWITVDVGSDSDVVAGDEVVLVGRQGNEAIWADELAAKCRTIAYEILTFIHPNLERRYTDAVHW